MTLCHRDPEQATPPAPSVREVLHDAGPPGPAPLVLIPLYRLITEPDVPIDWRIDELIAVGSINVLAGKPKAGKSHLARQLAVLHRGRKLFLGQPTKPGAVWYLALEDQRSEVLRHFRRLRATGDEPIEFLFGNKMT